MIAAFEAFGLELEYMLVRRDTLDVLPIAERVLPRDEPAWSHELVAHLVELRNPQPSADLAALCGAFHSEIREMNRAAAPLGAQLMPGGMHPWMDPRLETRLWPHDDEGIYATYHRIFDCRAHGWANLQSVQVNLPFAGDAEFARLHAAVRLALPILPAIAAASPFCDGRARGALDCRLEAYRGNADPVPAMNGRLIPEPMASRAQYERELLAPLYEALAPHDPEGVLRHEWANARGAIARFEREAIEIRVLDLQECPAADVAIAAASIDLVRLLYEEPPAEMVPTEELARMLEACTADAERAHIDSVPYLRALHMERPCSAGELWRRLGLRMERAPHRELWQPVLDFISHRGPLARRLLEATGPAPDRRDLAPVYRTLCQCLAENRLFDPSRCS